MSDESVGQAGPGKKAGLRQKLGLACFASLLMLFVGEMGLRFFSRYGYVTPAILKERSLPYEPAVFARHAFGHGPRTAEDGALKYRINSLGYRGADFSFVKQSNMTRVVVLGGSAVFDLAAQEGCDWPHLAEIELRKRGWTNVEVINAGIPGHASFDSFGRLFSEVHLMNPDIVVIYNAWNDLKDFADDRPLLRRLKPFAGDPRLEYFNGLDRVLCNLSQIYVRLRARWINVRYRVGSEGAATTMTPATSGFASNAIAQYRFDMRVFCDAARDIGAEPILMTQARLVARTNGPQEKKCIEYQKAPFTHDQLCDAFELTDSIIRDVAREKRATLVDAAAEATGSLLYCYDHVHTTAEGSKLLARLLADGCASVATQRLRNAATPPAGVVPAGK